MIEDFELAGNIVDVVAGRMFRGRIVVSAGRVADVVREGEPDGGSWLIPGLVESHLHVESTMLPPSRLAEALLPRGTVAMMSDPHEIANVMGAEGVRFMLEDAAKTPLAFHFGAPSCVPATPFESAGARFGPDEIGALLDDPRIGYLSEMMNFPGVVGGDPKVLAVLAEAKRRGKPVDGHAPALSGEALRRYVAAGISTEHECTTLAEAREKASLGVKILIREGSSARNATELLPLVRERPEMCMFCCDDLHPGDIFSRGHIDHILRMAVSAGIDPIAALRAATLNPVAHYGLANGLLRAGDAADIVEVDNLRDFGVTRVWIGGKLVAVNGRCLASSPEVAAVNNFGASPVPVSRLRIPAREGRIRVIVARDGQLLTGTALERPKIADGFAVEDVSRDILRIVVVSRYSTDSAPALGFVRGFGLKSGALASSVAHDSHNIVAVGADVESLARAIGIVVKNKGALVAAGEGGETVLPLPVGGLMSDLPWREVARLQEELDARARELGAVPKSPLMLLSFMALPVMPSLKITDRGLFDVDAFRHADLWE